MLLAVGWAGYKMLAGSSAHVETLEPRQLLSAGSLDTSFSGDGMLTTGFGGPSAAGNAVAVQADGKIVVAGIGAQPPDDIDRFVVARFNADGTVDTSFGGGKGVVFFNPLQIAGVPTGGRTYGASSVAIGPGGSIYVGGSEDRQEGALLVSTWALLKLKPNGDLQTGWGNGGATFATFGESVPCSANSIAVRSDGSLIVAGSLGRDGIVGEIAPNGFFAPGFGSGGFVDVTFPSLSPVQFNSVALQSDGKIVAAGNVVYGIGVARLTSSGALDPTFGTGGRTMLGTDNGTLGALFQARSVAIAPNGDIMVGGRRSYDPAEWLLARLLPNGTIDTSYKGGYTFVHFPGEDSYINAIVVQPDGNTLVAGSEGSTPAVARFKPDGNFDSTFGTGGITMVVPPSKKGGTFNGIAFGADGKITVVGGLVGTKDELFAARVQSGITTGAIAGTIYNDANANGKHDAGETGIASRTVYIDKNKNGKLDAGEPKTTTTSTGAYAFAKLALGSYRVRQIVPTGWRATSPSAGYFDVTVSAGTTSGSKDFADTTKSQISGIVFKDTNANRLQDKGESALAGWILYLDANNNGKLDTGEQKITTGSDGRFTFVVAAGTYHLREVLKSGFTRTTPAAGVYTITLGGGQIISGENFGNR